MEYKLNEALSRELAEQLQIETLEKRRKLKNPKQGNCYIDAIQVVTWLGRKAKYVEGQACHIVPVEHAFVIFERQIIDVTWVTKEPMENTYVPSLVLSIDRVLATLQVSNKTPLWQTVYGWNSRKKLTAKQQANLGKFLEFHNRTNLFKAIKLAGGSIS